MASTSDSADPTTTSPATPSTAIPPTLSPKTPIPYRQIRALYDDTTITVYQAYSSSIALAAVAHQRLDASPDFQYARMTWIKPSWTWMMYRSGHAKKDPRQAHILALRIPHDHFRTLLSLSSLAGAKGPKADIRIQWDPERSAMDGRLEYRSIQVGVGRSVVGRLVGEWVCAIEDVTERALRHGRAVKEGRVEEARACVPVEREYVLGAELRARLGMDVEAEGEEGGRGGGRG